MDAMELKKLTISVEAKSSTGARPEFDQSSEKILALFNPDKLVFSKTANWQKQGAKTQDNPELQFTNSEPTTLALDLLFDTYDSPDSSKADVRVHTEAVGKLIMVDGAKHRPPVCRLSWGAPGFSSKAYCRVWSSSSRYFLKLAFRSGHTCGAPSKNGGPIAISSTGRTGNPSIW